MEDFFKKLFADDNGNKKDPKQKSKPSFGDRLRELLEQIDENISCGGSGG